MPLVDKYERQHRYLRISLTDRCNLRCLYCMPKEGLQWIPNPQILSASEIITLGQYFVDLGIEHIRLTGGEPTLRKDLLDIVQGLSNIQGLQELSMTTNGLKLNLQSQGLREAGLNRINISIDSLKEHRFAELTRGGKLAKVLQGIDAAHDAGFGTKPHEPIKLNAVILPNKNDDELLDFVLYCSEHPAYIEPRFIEYMPFKQRWHDSPNTQTLLEKLQENIPLIPVQSTSQNRGPARQYLVPTHNITIGFISPISQPFCSTCNRLRLSANGELRACLAKDHFPALRDVLRRPHTTSEIYGLIQRIVTGKVLGHQCGKDQKAPVPFEGIMTQIGG